METITLKDINLGGIAFSKYQGVANSVAQIVGLDLHSEPGIVKVNQKLTKESGTTIDSFVKCILPCSDGNTYLFSSTLGKIWQRTSTPTYSLVATAAPGAGSAGIMDAIEDQGYIYYTMQNRVGRWQIGTAWSGRNDNWATFTNGDADFHPIKKVNLVVYIGDKNYVAQIDSGVFSANALDVKSPLRIKSLGQSGTDLLIGVYVDNNVDQTEIFNWNTWSESFSSEDSVPELGINSFLKTDNISLVNVGQKGFIYVYDGVRLQRYSRINGDWAIGKTAYVHPNASANINGLPLFAFSNVSGNPCLQGIYSLGNYSPALPAILNLEYVISQNKTSSIEIGALAVVGDLLLCSWKDGTTYGIDRVDISNKYTGAYFDTRVIAPSRSTRRTGFKIQANYRSLPTGTSIAFQKRINGGDFVGSDGTTATNLEVVVDSIRKIVYSKIDIGDFNSLEIRTYLVASGNTAPELESLDININ